MQKVRGLFRREVFLVVTAVCVAGSFVGCDALGPLNPVPRYRSMTTQDGDLVEIHTDWQGDYYYDKGSKVRVNDTGGTRTDDRPTRW